MEGNVRLQCPECRTWMIVMPSEIYEAVGNISGIEGEVQFLQQLKDDTAQTGDRLAVADATRSYVCPVCSHQGQLPPAAELAR
jgi:predicted RNA-binding Zn-ribbon protein involved in translation (DUF1610 family)